MRRSLFPHLTRTYLTTLSTTGEGIPVLCLSTDVTFGVFGGSNVHNIDDHYVTDALAWLCSQLYCVANLDCATAISPYSSSQFRPTL